MLKKSCLILLLLPLSALAAETYQCEIDPAASAQVFKEAIQKQIELQAKGHTKQMSPGNAYSLVMKAVEAGIAQNDKGSVRITLDRAGRKTLGAKYNVVGFNSSFNKLPESTLPNLPSVKAAIQKAEDGKVVAADLEKVTADVAAMPKAKKWKPSKEEVAIESLKDAWAMLPEDEKGREAIAHLLGGRKDLDFASATGAGMLQMIKVDGGGLRMDFTQRLFKCEKAGAKAAAEDEKTGTTDAN